MKKKRQNINDKNIHRNKGNKLYLQKHVEMKKKRQNINDKNIHRNKGNKLHLPVKKVAFCRFYGHEKSRICSILYGIFAQIQLAKVINLKAHGFSWKSLRGL